VEGVGVVELAAEVHGEFEVPTEGFDDAGGGDFVSGAVGEGDFDVWALLEGGDLEVDAEAVTVGVGLGGEGGDVGFVWEGAFEVVFGEEKFHVGIIPSFVGGRRWVAGGKITVSLGGRVGGRLPLCGTLPLRGTRRSLRSLATT